MVPQIIHFVSLALSSLSGNRTSATCVLQAIGAMKEEPICQKYARLAIIDQFSKPIDAFSALRVPFHTKGVFKTT